MSAISAARLTPEIPAGRSGLEMLLAPRSVAIVGASDNPAKVGGRPLRHLLAHGYRGGLFPVSARAAHVQGVPAYPRIAELPEAPDAVVLAVPAEAVAAEITACADLGVRSVVLFSSGYAEVGAAGRVAQDRLAAQCREAGIRLLGPNTIGSANFANGAVLSAASRATLDTVLPPFSLNRNPIDLTAMLLADPALLGRAIDIVLNDSGVNVAVLGLLAIGGPSYDVPHFARSCAAASLRAGKPIVVHAPDRGVRDAFANCGFSVHASEHAALATVAQWIAMSNRVKETAC